MRKTMLQLTACLVAVASSVAFAVEETDLWESVSDIPHYQESQIAIQPNMKGSTTYRIDKRGMPYLRWYTKPSGATSPMPCIILVSGGAYNNISDFSQSFYSDWQKKLTAVGIQCVDLFYRTPRPEGLPIYQSAWDDGQRAVRVIRSQAAARGIDPDRIGVISMSAGSHMATLLATSSKTNAYEPADEIDQVSPRINVALANAIAYGMSDGLTGPNTNSGIGATLDTIFKFDDQTCPMCMTQGGKDEYSPLSSSMVWRKLREKGVATELHIYPDKGHSAYGIERHIEFLRMLGWIPALGEAVTPTTRWPDDSARVSVKSESLYADGTGGLKIEWHNPKVHQTGSVQILLTGPESTAETDVSNAVVSARRYLNAAGITVVTAQIRSDAAVADARQAVRAVRAGAASRGLNPDYIGLMGYRADATAAVLASTATDADSKVKWSVAISPTGLNGAAILPDTKAAPTLFVHEEDNATDTPVGSVASWEVQRELNVQDAVHTLAGEGNDFIASAVAPGTAAYNYLDRVSDFLSDKKLLAAWTGEEEEEGEGENEGEGEAEGGEEEPEEPSVPTLYVSATATAGVGDGSYANPYTMSEAWSKVRSGDTIKLLDGTYVETAVRGDGAAFTVRDKSNIIFLGNATNPENVIIDFNGSDIRGFYSPNQPFTIRGITFRNKKTSASRGVIAAGGTIKGAALVDNCRFENITTEQTSGDGRMGTVFTGGATANYVFRNCEFKDCNSYVWGMMYLTAGDLTLQGCTATNCHVKTTNGSIVGVNGGKSVTIEDSDFRDVGSEMSAASVDNYSGVIHVNSSSSAPVVVRRSRFWQGPDCHSRLGGFSAIQAGAELTFDDCEFYDFQSGNGWAGLFYFQGDSAKLYMTGCVISNATVMTNGGAIGVNGASAKIVLNDCRFMDCRCLNQADTAKGGLVYVAAGTCTIAMTNCVCEVVGDFDGAQSYNGGQININNVGGANVSVDRCVFRGIRALNAGGAIFSKATSGSLTVRNTLFTGCDITKQTSGATGIYTAGTSDVKIENCTFADNCPHGNSSNVAPLSPTSSNAKNYVKNCIFWNNRDQAGKGALRVTSSTGNTVFENCVADVSGLNGVSQISASPFMGAETGDYMLKRGANPCIGSGLKLDWMTAESLDLAGHRRLRDGDLVDLGCYAFCPNAGFWLFLR